MKRIILILACLCCTLHAQQPVTVLNNGAGGGTFNTPGVTTYFGGANTFNFVGSVVTGLPTNVGNTFTTLAVTGTTQLNGNVGIGGVFSANVPLVLDGTITGTGNMAGIAIDSSFTQGTNAGFIRGLNVVPLLISTGGFTGATYEGIQSATPTTVTGTFPNAYMVFVQNAPASTSAAGIAVATQTNGVTNNTDILYGTTTIPSGNNGIYQGDSYANYFNGATSFGGTVTSTNYALTGTGSFAVASIIGSALNGFQINEKTGATYDFVLENPAGNTMVLAVPTGTNTLEAVGNFFIGNNTLVLNGGGGGGGTAGSAVLFQKTVTAIADNTATTVLTITVPNAAHSAMIHVILNGSLGAGGAIGANEASATVTYDIVVTRTAGVNAVANAATAYGAANAIVAGGTSSITCTAALTAVSGAVGATNTFNFQVTIHRGNGAATNHTCQVSATTVNMNASGVTTT